jgi:Ni/Co efflux regulator RcnB
MTADRYRLLGTYATPAFSYGDVVTCEVRGDVILCGLTDAPIPWPLGKRRGKGARARSLIVFGALADAVRRESAQAVAHWWGVTAQTVSLWRKALSVGPVTEGTHELRSAQGHEPEAVAARLKAVELSHDPEADQGRRAKIAAALQGKPRRPEDVALSHAAHRGAKRSEEARKRMSAAQKARGTRPPKAGKPWTREEDELVKALPAPEVARRTGRPVSSVYSRRRKLDMLASERQ